MSANNRDAMTTASGTPVADDENSQTAGPRGPVLLQDTNLVEKLAHFNRERIPERVVHAKGAGAYGTFTVTHDLSDRTCASVLQVGATTALFVRFSVVGGERGSADSVRDPRGFAVKFYTPDGIWDLVGNNTPVFFIRDGIKFPDFIHTQKRNPATNLKDPTAMWDFWSLSPESLHQVTILFSDRGTPRTFRHMHGFGSHTFSLVDAEGGRVWVKFHLRTCQGIQNNTAEEAERLAGIDPDQATRDLFEAIERGEFPRWDLLVQVMTEAQAAAHADNPFDVTKVWSHRDYPLMPLGVVELNRNPTNYFEEVEQAAFSPAHVVRGIGLSPDKMLQARLFAYGDAQRYRLGANHQAIPVNRGIAPVVNHQRDGAMRTDGNGGSTPNYGPNSRDVRAAPRASRDPPVVVDGDGAQYDHRDGNDDFTQAGTLFRLLDTGARERLVENVVVSMRTVPEEIQRRQIELFSKADPEYGRGVATGLGLAPPVLEL